MCEDHNGEQLPIELNKVGTNECSGIVQCSVQFEC